jgi:mono/diheme cytochrome c family protein
MHILLTVIGTLVVLILAGLATVYSGVYDVAATSPDSAVVGWILQNTREHSIERRAEEIQVAKRGDAEQIQAGFNHYDDDCAGCHTPPGEQRSEGAKGMNPRPPKLAEEARELSTAEIFWIVKHGIKMTGMPAWGPTHKDAEIWDIVAFVKKLPDMKPAEYKAMKPTATDEGEAEGRQ